MWFFIYLKCFELLHNWLIILACPSLRKMLVDVTILFPFYPEVAIRGSPSSTFPGFLTLKWTGYSFVFLHWHVSVCGPTLVEEMVVRSCPSVTVGSNSYVTDICGGSGDWRQATDFIALKLFYFESWCGSPWDSTVLSVISIQSLGSYKGVRRWHSWTYLAFSHSEKSQWNHNHGVWHTHTHRDTDARFACASREGCRVCHRWFLMWGRLWSCLVVFGTW